MKPALLSTVNVLESLTSFRWTSPSFFPSTFSLPSFFSSLRQRFLVRFLLLVFRGLQRSRLGVSLRATLAWQKELESEKENETVTVQSVVMYLKRGIFY